MPLTPDMRRSIDQIRDYLFGGGYPDPVSNAEQLSFLFFFYLVEGIDAENRARARFLKKTYTSLFDGSWELKNPLNGGRRPGGTGLARWRCQRAEQRLHHPSRPLPLVDLGQGPVRRIAGALRPRRGVRLLRRAGAGWRDQFHDRCAALHRRAQRADASGANCSRLSSTWRMCRPTMTMKTTSLGLTCAATVARAAAGGVWRGPWFEQPARSAAASALSIRNERRWLMANIERSVKTQERSLCSDEIRPIPGPPHAGRSAIRRPLSLLILSDLQRERDGRSGQVSASFPGHKVRSGSTACLIFFIRAIPVGPN